MFKKADPNVYSLWRLTLVDIQYSYTRCFKLRVPTSTINLSCFGLNRRFPLLWHEDLDLYVLLESTIFRKSHFVPRIFLWTRVFPPPPSMCRVLDFIGVSPYFGLTIWICMSFLNRRFSQISCCSFIFHQFLRTWDFPNHLQRVVLLISYAFPSTLAYRFGFVCLFRTYDVSQIYWMV